MYKSIKYQVLHILIYVQASYMGNKWTGMQTNCSQSSMRSSIRQLKTDAEIDS